MRSRYTLCLYTYALIVVYALGHRLEAQAITSRTNSSAGTHRSDAQQERYTLRADIRARDTKEPIPFATIQIPALGLGAAADINGTAMLKRVPEGRYIIELSSMGYAKLRREIYLNKDLSLTLELNPETLGLREIVVTAKRNTESTTTSSTINRQAIDHLQAMSLADVMQLVPGQLMEATNLTTQSNIQVRSLVNNSTNAFGASVIVDGIPQSNNASLSPTGFSSTAFTGTDLRTISADELESVEVIRGIPSVEYGDLSSGLVITRSKVGVSPWNIRAKLNPSIYNISASKGWKLNKAGVVNLTLDYAQAWGDPRMKTRSFDRYNLSLGYATHINRNWHTTTKFRYNLGKDWSGNDPDAIQEGSESWADNHLISFSHNGKVNINQPLSRTLSYTIGANLGIQNSHQTAIVAAPSGALHILSARTTGYHVVPIQSASYRAGGGTESRPFSLFAKISNQINIKTGGARHNIAFGADYGLDYNNARGYYNDDDLRPLKNNEDGRPRAYYEIPAAHRLSAYAEDNIRLKIGKSSLKVMAGLRLTALQPGSELAAYSLSPRLNAVLSLTRWLDLNAGIGWNAKTPGLNHLYPAPKYTDNVSVNYNDVSNPAGALVIYHTYVQHLEKSKNLKNAVNRKIEIGADVKLPAGRRLSLTAYLDYCDTGFSPLAHYTAYSYNLYNATQGLIITPGAPTVVQWNNPANTYTKLVTTGEIGNTSVARNRGLELECELGEVRILRTQFFLSGAYSETMTWDNGKRYTTPKSLPAQYTSTNTIPFLLRYPSGVERSEYRRFLNTLRVVTHIPELKMVASLTGQVIWYNYSHSIRPYQRPEAWLALDLVEHPITKAMLEDHTYTIDGVLLSNQVINDLEAVPTRQPITWQVTGRLTKELGKVGSLSIYANNLFFYEPYMTSNRSSTLSQRNTGTFNFGAELSIKL